MRFAVWGLTGTLRVSDASCLDVATTTLYDWIGRADRAVNRFLPDSEISQLNRHPGTPRDMSDDFMTFLDAARVAFDVSEGLCDPTVGDALRNWGYDQDYAAIADRDLPVPARSTPANGFANVVVQDHRVTLVNGTTLDFGASAKALVVDRVVAALEDRCGVLVEIGGDVAVRSVADQEPWHIGVSVDARVGEHNPTVDFSYGGMATSATTLRTWKVGGHTVSHIIDPRTGAPASPGPWTAVTVAAESCLIANAFTTASILRDEDAPYYVAQAGWAGRFVHRDLHVERVGGWPEEMHP